MTEKSQSVRSQRFTEHMATLYQNIDTMVYAAEVACHNHEVGMPKCRGCPFTRANDLFAECELNNIRNVIGDHFPQGDIKELGVTE